MIRTKIQPGINYNVSNEPMFLSKHLLDTLLSQDKPDELICLYAFYYYTAKWQRSNKLYATTRFVSQGLRWSEGKVKRVKSRLKELGLIESQTIRGENNKIMGHYVKINFIWESQKVGFPPGGKSTLWYLNNINTNKEKYIYHKKDFDDSDTISKTESIKQRNQRMLPLCRYLSKIITSQKNIEINRRKLAVWSNDLRLLQYEDGIEVSRMKRVLQWYKDNIGKPYVPDVQSGSSFRKKFLNLEAAISRSQNNTDHRQPDKVLRYGRWWYWNDKSQAYYNKDGDQLIE